MTVSYEIQADIINGMRIQEQKYLCGDYLYQDSSNCSRLNLPQSAIDVTCRTSMMQWMKTAVNFIGFDLEVVEISMSYLDRFLDTPAGVDAKNCRILYQLASMTALYTAVKITCNEALTPKLLEELSQGAYKAAQFEEMEAIMLAALSWRVNPCTGVSFVRETVALLPAHIFQTEAVKVAVVETARLQAEWAVEDYDLLTVKKSVIAFAAVANSLRCHKVRCNLKTFLQNLLSDETDAILDLQHAIFLQNTLREALPAPIRDDCSSTQSSSVFELDDEGRPKETAVATSSSSMPWGKSPRSVAYRKVAAYFF